MRLFGGTHPTPGRARLRRHEARLRLPQDITDVPALRTRLHHEPMLVGNHARPPGTCTTRTPDWPWRLRVLANQRTDAEGPKAVCPQDFGLDADPKSTPDRSAAITMDVRLYGPGDVIGLDPRQIVGTDSAHLTSYFEPNYFPSVELDRTDSPWLFSPALPEAGQTPARGRLQPWLCLVVMRRQPAVALRVDPRRPFSA